MRKIALLGIIFLQIVNAETFKNGYIGCISESYLDDVVRFANNKDYASMGRYEDQGKCKFFRRNETVSVIKKSFSTVTVVYKGTKLIAPREAID